MTNQNTTESNPKSVTNPAPKDGKPTEIKRELTDAETAAVAGGHHHSVSSAPPQRLGGGTGNSTNG